MPNLRTILAAALFLVGVGGCQKEPARRPAATHAHQAVTATSPESTAKVVKTEAEWRASLTPEQYRVLREEGTEPAFTGAFYDAHEPAIYVCAGCGLRLFSSEQKFDSGTGWPSFWAPIRADAVSLETDATHGMSRTEVTCSRCGGHLGHVFDDGPKPTGQRYCINSVSLEQIPLEAAKDEAKSAEPQRR